MPKVLPGYKEKAMKTIIEAGAHVFFEKGYHLTRMDDIAERMGVSKGAIYQYFNSKEQLFFDVMDFFMKTRKDEVMSILLSDDPMWIASPEFFEMKIERALQTRAFGLDLFLEASRNEILREKIAEMFKKSYEDFLRHFEDLKKKGVFKKDADVGVIWRGIVALRDGLISSIFLGGNTLDAKETWVKTTTLLLREVFIER